MRCLQRHDLNDRYQEATLRNYVASVKKQGAVAGVRGAPWVVEAKDPNQYLLLTYGTLAEAVYQAYEQEPTNGQIIATIRAGISNAMVFNQQTPDCVLKWLMNFHNLFHGGSNPSFIELLKEPRHGLVFVTM